MGNSLLIQHSKPWLDQKDNISVKKQMLSNQISFGSESLLFQNSLCEYLNQDYVKTTSNGTNAIYLALKAIGVNENDEIILPSYVCKNVFDAIINTGAKPVFCDLGTFWTISLEEVKKVITKKTKAIIAVHSLGTECDINSLLSLGITVIEDSCQYFKPQSSRNSDNYINVYSFHATKCLTTGEGGAISTPNLLFQERLDKLILNKCLYNPLCDLQATLGLSQLKKYEESLGIRRKIAKQYFSYLPHHLTEKFRKVSSKTIFFRFLLTVSLPESSNFIAYLKSNQIIARKGVDSILSNDIKFSNTLQRFNETISIPIYPSLKKIEIDKIIKKINNYEFR